MAQKQHISSICDEKTQHDKVEKLVFEAWESYVSCEPTYSVEEANILIKSLIEK